MDQHVISAWLLRAFAGRGGHGAMLHVYDKTLDRYDQVSIDDFLAETDAHSSEVEQEIGRIEGPAARAASNLAARVKPLPGGFYAIVPRGEATRSEGPSISDKGVIAGMRLQVSEHQLASPSDGDRLALAKYAGLLYNRAPKVEAALEQFDRVFERGSQAVLDQLMPGMRSGLIVDINERRTRMTRNARNVGPVLAAANWWIVRARAGEEFVLGDNPVVTTVALGHDDSWRPILGQATYVVVMPLAPILALVVAPKIIIPVSGFENPDQAAMAINRLVWRSADRYVLARTRDQLDRAIPAATSPSDDRQSRSTSTSRRSPPQRSARRSRSLPRSQRTCTRSQRGEPRRGAGRLTRSMECSAGCLCEGLCPRNACQAGAHDL